MEYLEEDQKVDLLQKNVSVWWMDVADWKAYLRRRPFRMQI